MSEVKRYMHIEPLVEADARMRSLCSRATIYVKESDYDAAQSQLVALREELAKTYRSASELASAMTRDVADLSPEFELFDYTCGVIGQIDNMYAGMRAERNALRQRLADAERRNAESQKQLDSIDNHLRGNVNDPDPLPPIMPGAVSYTTTFGLVSGLRRERDYLRKSATPLPAGDDYLRQLAQRLREYVGNPHHIDPLSEAFKRLIDDSEFALSKLAALNKPEEAKS